MEGEGSVAPEYVPALTWRSILAILFACVVIQPAMMYLYLVTGAGLAFSTWLVILLWSEVCRLLGSPLSKQETFIIMSFEATAVSAAWVFLSPVKNLFFVMSPITRAFGFTRLVPNWWAPYFEEAFDVWAAATLLHPQWHIPILVLVLTASLGLIADIAMGYFCYQLYVVTERLPFPLAMAGAYSIATIAERESNRVRVLMLATLGGIIYGLLSHFLPFVTGSSIFMIAPRGTRDFSYLTEYFLTGSSFGIDTTFTTFATGFILPMPVLTVMFLTSLGAYFLGNHYLYEFGIWPEWVPGMQVGTAWMRSQLYFWTSVGIGFSLAATLIPLLMRPRILIGAFRSLTRTRGQERGASAWLLLALFFSATLGAVLLVHILVPGFPLWILIAFSVGWSFFASFISANAQGVGASSSFNIPYLRESVIYFSGYKGIDIWFANYLTWSSAASGALPPPNIGLPLISVSGANIAAAFKQADFLGVLKKDYIYAFVLVTATSFLMSFLYTNLFLNIANIPSSAYPYTITGWPVEVMERNRWIQWLWSGILFKPDVVLESLAFGTAVTVASVWFKVTYVPVSITMGIFSFPPSVISQFIGGVLGNFVLRRFFGQQKWSVYAPLIVTGLFIGDTIIYMVDSAILLAIKSQWLLPY
ncbi:MAG: hypothetical protein QXF26_04575 [Candidatus Bathyarchaeia archaeon]